MIFFRAIFKRYLGLCISPFVLFPKIAQSSYSFYFTWRLLLIAYLSRWRVNLQICYIDPKLYIVAFVNSYFPNHSTRLLSDFHPLIYKKECILQFQWLQNQIQISLRLSVFFLIKAASSDIPMPLNYTLVMKTLQVL